MIDIYKASTENVRELKTQYTTLLREINNAVLYNRNAEIIAFTKLFALLYSAFAEVSFLKLIHTPYGLNESMISNIIAQRSLEEKWKKCIELSFNEIAKQSNLGLIANKKMRLNEILNEYIIKPSQIRNKIAHGQWIVALNNESTAVNTETTALVNDLDYVKIDVLFRIYDKFEKLIEDLIESPNKTHYRDFYTTLNILEELIEKTKDWDINTRRSRIKRTKKKHL